MTRLPGRRRVVSGWLAAALLAATALTTLSAPASATDPVDEVHYTFTSSTSVALDWRGAATDVRWGPTTAYGNTATGTAPAWTPWSSPGPFWQAEITGLAPGSLYHYSIGGGPNWTFHTPPTSSFRFDAIGDVGDTTTYGHLAGTLSAIAADNPSFVLMVGDLTYANSSGASISVIDQHFDDVMNSWGTSAAYIPAWGNHEYDPTGADDLRNYKGRLLMPNQQASPGSPAVSCCGDDWGWFDAGPVRFIAYPEPWTGAWADWQSKANALMSQAQNDPSIKYIVTYGHRPAYSTGYHPGEAQLASILDTFGASFNKYVLNINGHSHDYERFQPIQGVTHVTVGSASSLELPWSSTDPRTAFRAYHLAHLRVDVSDTGLRLQAICDEASSKDDYTCSQGSVMDEYTIGVPPTVKPRTEYYVDKTMTDCSDAGPGTAQTPFCTIARGVARLQPGMTLYVGNGTYAETVKPAVSGSAGSPITITAWPGRSPVIGTGVTYGAYLSTRSYVTVSKLAITDTVSDGIYVTKSDHITVSDNSVSNAGRPAKGATANGVSLRATNDSTVSGNTSDHNAGHGFYITSNSTGNLISSNEASYNAYGWERNANGIDVTAPNNTVLRNVTHDNEDSGIQFFTGGDNGVAALNLTYNNGDHGIDDLNVTGGRIISNTVFHNCTTGINVEGTSGNYTVANNVAVDNAVYAAYNGIACKRRAGNIGIWDSAPSTTTVDHNLVNLSKAGTMYAYGSAYSSLAAMQAATGQEKHGVQASPSFVDAASGNFQLSGGSAAIDRGDSAVSGAQDHDLLGNTRVDDPATPNDNAEGPRLYDDLGAYEFQPGPGQASAPTAALSVSPTSWAAPLSVTADASASTDPQGGALSYAFDFGDGSSMVGPQSSPTATHSYTQAGTRTLTVTVSNASGLSSTATKTVTVTAPVTAPTARLTVTPTSGSAPLAVSADASASTDPQGQTLSYTFDFGDGSPVVGPQSGALANHTYAAGSYTTTLTVRNTSGLSATATSGVTVSSASTSQPKYVEQIATNNSNTANKTSGYVTVWRAGGVPVGEVAVVTLQLIGSPGTGPVTATDAKGNSYAVASDVADGQGGRLVVLYGRMTAALDVNDKITAGFPAAAGYRMIADRLHDAGRVDVTASASGTSAAFSSGPTSPTSPGPELVFGAVALTGGTGAPTWDPGWSALSPYAVGTSYVGRAWRASTSSTALTATGSGSGRWLATVVAFGS
jgi:parallel beta-helix repeat protein